MSDALEDIEALFDAVKCLRSERRKMARLSEKAFNANGPKDTERANANLNWAAFQVIKTEHRVHALAVNAGIASARPAKFYEPYQANLSGWHTYRVTPDKPRALLETEE